MATNGSTIAAFCKAASCLSDLPSDSREPHITCVDGTNAQAVELAMAENTCASWGRLIVHEDLKKMVSDTGEFSAHSCSTDLAYSKHSVAGGQKPGRRRPHTAHAVGTLSSVRRRLCVAASWLVLLKAGGRCTFCMFIFVLVIVVVSKCS